jgi:hypothetical protein
MNIMYDEQSSGWMPVKNTYPVNFSSDDGEKTVTVQYCDALGNISSPCTATIIIDSTPPVISAVKQLQDWTSQNNVPASITWETNDPPAGEKAGSSVTTYNIYWGLGEAPHFDTTGHLIVTTNATVFLADCPLNFGDGVYFLQVQAMDNLGNTSDWYTLLEYRYDCVVPEGSIQINSGIEYTNTKNISIKFNYNDALSGVVSLNIMYNGEWQNWEPITEFKQLTLSAGDGEKTVTVQYRDAAGNESDFYAASVKLDTTTPSIIDDEVTLEGWTATGNRAGFSWIEAIDETSGVAAYDVYWGTSLWDWGTASWNPISPTITITGYSYVASFDPPSCTQSGTYNLFVRPLDNAGNIGDWRLLLQYRYDADGPAGGIKINNGATYTSGNIVLLQLNASDVHCGIVSSMNINNSAVWEKFNDTRSFQLPMVPAGNPNYVRIRYMDALGNIGTQYSASIYLDRDASQISALQKIVSSTSIASPGLISWNATDSGSGIKGFNVYYGAAKDGTSDVYQAASSYAPPDCIEPGGYYLRVQAVDNVGNKSDWSTLLEYHYDPFAISGNIRLNNGASITNTFNITLDLDYSGGDGGITLMNIQCDLLETGWIAVNNSYSLSLPAGDGEKIVTVTYCDAAGNTSSYAGAIILDSTAPVLSINTEYQSVTDNKVPGNISWPVAVDAISGVAGYNVYWGVSADGTTANFQPNNSYSPPDCETAGAYYLRVQTVDNLSNASEWQTVLIYWYDDSLSDSDYEENPADTAVAGNGGTGEQVWSYPNPFSPAKGSVMRIAYGAKEDGFVRVMIYDLRGRRIWQAEKYSVAGENTIAWDGRDYNGSLAANGTYLLIVTDERKKIIARGRMMLLD